MKRIYFFIFLLLLPACVKKNVEAPQMPAVLQQISLKVDWMHTVQFLGFYLAQEKGLYKQEGLEVNIHEISKASENPEVPYQIARREYDIGLGSSSVIIAQEAGTPLTFIAAIYHYGPHVLFAKKASGIRSIEDFRGRRIVNKGQSWWYLTCKMLEVVGLTEEDVIPVEGGFDMTPFYEDQVDIWSGYITTEVVEARLKGYEIVTFPLYEYGFVDLGSFIYSSPSFLAANEDRTLRFLRASLKGWEWAVTHQQEAMDIFFNLFPENEQKRIFYTASFEASIPLINPPGVQIGEIDCLKPEKKFSEPETVSFEVCSDRFFKQLRKELDR